MQQVRLSEQLYNRAQRRAAEAGFATVDEFVAVLLNEELSITDEQLDLCFDVERIAKLDRISSRVKSGESAHTLEQVAEHFEKKRQSWPQNRVD